MKIIALMVVKNEDDIVGHCLDKASEWADHIIIMNNGSTDTTEDVILQKVKEHNNIIYWGRYDGVFRDGLRGLLYLDNQELFSPGDWIIRLDADEIYIDDPREFLANAPEQVNFVMSASFQYYYTDKDYEQQISNPKYLETPPQDRLKYYSCNWSEYRCAKIGESSIWPLGTMRIANSWPQAEVKYIYSKRIHLKHFKYRSLEQIKKRVDTRLPVFEKTKLFGHEAKNLNEKRIYESKKLNFDNGDTNNLIFNYDKLPPLTKPKAEKDDTKIIIV